MPRRSSRDARTHAGERAPEGGVAKIRARSRRDERRRRPSSTKVARRESCYRSSPSSPYFITDITRHYPIIISRLRSFRREVNGEISRARAGASAAPLRATSEGQKQSEDTVSDDSVLARRESWCSECEMRARWKQSEEVAPRIRSSAASRAPSSPIFSVVRSETSGHVARANTR